MVYLAFPLVFATSVAVLFDIPLSEMAPLFLSPFFYLVCVISMLAGVALWEVRRWAWHAFMVANVFVFYEAAYVAAHFGSSHHKVLALVFVALTLLIFMNRVSAEIRVPYFFPRIRWWETGSRGVCAIPVEMKVQLSAQAPEAGKAALGEILDLSMHGCFVKTPEWFVGEERVWLQFEYARQKLSCQGILLWRAQSTVTYPHGLGIYFPRLERAQRRMLRVMVHRIKRQNRAQKKAASQESKTST